MREAGIMELEEIRLLKQSETGTVYLMRERNGETCYIRKVLQEPCPIYRELKDCRHPYLPKFYDVNITDNTTTILEEYIEGELLSDIELSEKQVVIVIKELCAVLEFLHGNGIIHRDIKSSNIMLAKDGHIRLLDFDIARMPRKDREQDTRLLGTRGYAPPEQYGFAQTDERSDIYALGVTIQTLLKDTANKPYYDRIIQKCINMNPDNRYRSVKQVERAFSYRKRFALCIPVILIVLMLCGVGLRWSRETNRDRLVDTEDEPVILPAPAQPHWDGETGEGVWGNVPGCNDGSGEVAYHFRLYRRDTDTPPDIEKEAWDLEDSMRGNGAIDEETGTYRVNMAPYLGENGYYYFTVSADGDGVHYADSPYVLSDVFAYSGESAPELPAPTGLQWRMFETDDSREYYAAWSNLDEYADEDSFRITVYDQDGNEITRNIWTKEYVIYRGDHGIKIQKEYLSDLNNKYRFTVEVLTSRPNEYRSFLLNDPVPEEYFSPWYEW